MAPKIELEADHLRDKARKDLLALLEGVSKAKLSTMCQLSRRLTIVQGPWQEESSDREGLDRTNWSRRQVFDFAGVWRR
jgi:hypothetical protein